MKISIHPLFLAAGLLSAIFGGFPIFIICALTALLHECGHVFCAERLGYECKKISLMPYGASAICDIEGISLKDEVVLALAGPAVNFAVMVVCAGLWWFFPQTYAYTDVLFYSNAAMLLLNLLPAYPLDGGRVARCVLLKYFRPKTAEIVTRLINIAAAATLIALFFTVYKNYTLIAVAAFLACSALEKTLPAQKIDFAGRKKKRGKEIKYVILDSSATYRDALRFLSDGKYLIIQIYEKDVLDEITEDELLENLQTAGIYDRLYRG